MPFFFTAPIAFPRRFAGDGTNVDYRDIHAAADAQLDGYTDGLTDSFDGLANSATDPTPSAAELLDWAAFDLAVEEATKAALTKALTTAADAAAGHLWRDLGGNGGQPPVGILTVPSFAPEPQGAFVGRFDLLNPESVAWIDTHAAELVRQVSDDTRAAIRAIIRRSFEDGITPADTARMLRSVIGLTERGANAVYNYEKFLRGYGTGPIDSLSKTEIDRLRRGGLRRNQVNKLKREGLSEERIQKLVDGYRARLIRERAESVARTETLRASNVGQLSLWQQAMGQGLLRPTTKKMWIVTPDDRACEACLAAGGQKVPINQAFSTEYGPVMTPPAHVRCRCAMGTVDLFG